MIVSNKTIFITGATHGIGKATTELFCQKGWQVYGVSSNPLYSRLLRYICLCRLLPAFYQDARCARKL